MVDCLFDSVLKTLVFSLLVGISAKCSIFAPTVGPFYYLLNLLKVLFPTRFESREACLWRRREELLPPERFDLDKRESFVIDWFAF